MKVVMLTTEQGNQIALTHKLLPHCEVSAIVLSKNLARKRMPLKKRFSGLARRASLRMSGRPFFAAWSQMQQAYRESYKDLPEVPVVRVDNVNEDQTIEIFKQNQPELIVVSGTNLVSRKTIESAPREARWVNLHTGISPYVKGGPNCTNWCLAERTFHLIGNTIMWLDPGIDSGHIITTEQTTLNGRETLFDLHWKVMEHAHDLYARVIRRLVKGQALSSVPQDSISQGRTFYSAEWNGLAARRALRNFEKHYPPYFKDADAQHKDRESIKLVSLDPSH